MGHVREGRWKSQVVWRTVFAAGGIFFRAGRSLGGRNQHRESADLRVRPLGRQPKTPVPTGSPTTWIGNPNVDPSADTA